MLPKTILVATDFSEHADQALEYAAGLAAKLGASLHLVHATAIPGFGAHDIGLAYTQMAIDEMTKAARDTLDAQAARYRDRVSIESSRVELGDARDVIERVAEQIDADLIVMGTHGRRGLRRMLLGSVAESVVRSAPCPVLTIRPRRSS